MNHSPAGTDWEQRIAVLWESIDEYAPDDFRNRVDALAAELPADSAIAAFERACAFDSTGVPDRAEPLYRKALETGLTGIRRRRAAIQLSSSLRVLGRLEESHALLAAEMSAESDSLDDAVKAVLALVLTDMGREREAVSLVLTALAPHLPRYQRSMANYARMLVEPAPA